MNIYILVMNQIDEKDIVNSDDKNILVSREEELSIKKNGVVLHISS